ncbi:hypothetical protein OPQ81_006841 [Rhizoctonia solani]|nr:hypothetical protein OPQ81_006841 [Rhizoctonia solani]
MKFTHFVPLLATVVFATVLVAAAPVPTLNRSHITGRCSGCHSGEQALSLVSKLQADVHDALALLDNRHATGSNPADLFIELATKIDQCNSAAAAAKVDGANLDSKMAVQVSDITAKIILDISTGCSKFRNVKIDGLPQVDLFNLPAKVLAFVSSQYEGLLVYTLGFSYDPLKARGYSMAHPA